jgi:ring-1,2-phenylacetyl-CoA epoxidase subunit PaaB
MPARISWDRKLPPENRRIGKVPDTQWPRFQVFLQEKVGDEYQDVGSVHAPDAEMALLNARDVFARRPDCSGLWVVSAALILSKTRSELQTWEFTPPQDDQPEQVFAVFCKTKSAGTARFTGIVRSSSSEAALAAAVKTLTIKPEPFTWWVFPTAAITSTTPEDEGPMFSSAYDKSFRGSSDYHMIAAMRKVRQEKD